MNNTNTNTNTFSMTLTPDGASLHAYAWALPDGWRAWSPHALRILRKPYRHARTHLELTDDVVSSLYDPQGARNTAAAFGLANVPELGLVQVYGGLATAETQEKAVQAAALNSARLVAALQGRFRQSRFTLLSGDEAAALYRHLWDCHYTASLIGQMVPRLAPGMGSGHGINQLVTTDAQEQLEVIAAALAGEPFAVLTLAHPLHALDIRRMLTDTAQALSYFASKVKQSESANVSAVLPLFLNPVAVFSEQTHRATQVTRADQSLRTEQNAHRLAAGQSDSVSAYRRETASHEAHQGQENTGYYEKQHVSEQVNEHEEAQVSLERDYADRYSLSRSYSGSEAGVVQTQGARDATQQGNRQQHTDETGNLHSAESINERVSGVRSGAGSRSSVENFSVGERYSGGSSRAWEGGYNEQTERSFSGAGNEHSEGGYQQSETGASSVYSSEGFDRSTESNVQGDGAQMQTYADQGVEGNLAPRIFGIGGGETMEAGERGNMYESRDHEIAQAEGNLDTTRDTQQSTVTAGFEQSDNAYERSGNQQEALGQTWQGNETVQTAEWRSGGGVRSSQVAYGYSEAYQDASHTDREAQRAWESAVDQDTAWQQATRDGYQGVEHFARTFSGSYAETGQRSGHLSQQDVIVADRALQRETNRVVNGFRSETFDGYRDSQEQIDGAEARQEAMIGEGREYVQAQAAEQVGATVANAGRTQVTTRGVMGPSGGSLVAGLAFGRQIVDTQRDLVAQLLDQQVRRLSAGLDTGLFLTQVTLLAPDESRLERLAAASIAAMREENVVVPVAARAGDETLWQRAITLDFDERAEDAGPFDTLRHAQTLTANELSALVHPIRISDGTISASLDAWPEDLSHRRTQGEIALGTVLDVNLQPDPNNVHRFRADELMHAVIVGDSGSGKSNSALWFVSQVVNTLRQDEHGIPISAPITGPVRTGAAGGTPRIGVTVFDPTGEWRKLGLLIPSKDLQYYSLYGQGSAVETFDSPTGATGIALPLLQFNPLRIPSPYLHPAKWAAAFAKHWLLAYPAGATGFHQLKGAVLDAYRAAGVIEEDGRVYLDRSANLCMEDLHKALVSRFAALSADRSDTITAGVVKRIIDKLEEFLPKGVYWRAFGQPGGTTVTEWTAPDKATVITGKFGDDGPLKQFIIGLMVSGIYQHADERYEHYLRQGRPIPQHLLFVEEAHVVMRSDASSQTEIAQAIGEDAGLWNNITDRGRKLGLYLWTSAQHWEPLPSGVVTSSSIAIIQKVSTVKDAEIAVSKAGRLPGKTSLDDYSKWTLSVLNMPTGVGYVRRTRKTLSQESEMEIFPVQFVDISGIVPPADTELEMIVGGG
ncbi:MAG TPA: hypothetical protein PKZ84_06830 [Anaerolineae bacterium]|nr:hypothetical protein [Anaerolineae bacterium]HQI83402.1 hypothetical protein [Anaerolineae bacterium]